MWQITYQAAQDVIDRHHAKGLSYRKTVELVLQESGALSEINRLTALLAMKDETIRTLRERVLQDTATSEDDYDSGYRAA